MNYERLSSISLFYDLTPDTLKRIYELGQMIRVERPEIIIHERHVMQSSTWFDQFDCLQEGVGPKA